MIVYPQNRLRRSIRLKGYDYSKAGLYFITLCTHHRAHLFGHIANNIMVPNDAGNVAHACWAQIPAHFHQALLHHYIIMPNHVHGIIELTDGADINGANDDSPLPNAFRSPSKTIGSIVRGFKIGVTRWFRSHTDIETVWQRNYYEHIIRNETAYHNISNYIINNPSKWKEDTFNIP